MCMPRYSNHEKVKSLGFFLQCNPETETLYVCFTLFNLIRVCDMMLYVHGHFIQGLFFATRGHLRYSESAFFLDVFCILVVTFRKVNLV